MNKQELIHIHGLLSETAAYIDSDGRPVSVDFSEYEKEVSPTNITKKKVAHEEAISTLCESIHEAISPEESPQDSKATLPAQ